MRRNGSGNKKAEDASNILGFEYAEPTPLLAYVLNLAKLLFCFHPKVFLGIRKIPVPSSVRL